MKVADQFKCTGKHLIKEIRAHRSEILEMKRAEMKCADALINHFNQALSEKLGSSKSFLYENNEKAGELIRSIVANSYYWLDSHDDVHLSNLFSKSIREKGKKAPHLHDHIFELTARVGQTLGYEEKEISWRDLGVDKDGDTMALILTSRVLKNYNSLIYDDYLNDRIDQHSVRMSYVKVDFASTDEDYPEEYKQWQMHIDKIGNREQAEAQGYFFPVYEAKLFETSAVLLGSNEVTPVLGKHEPLKSTQSEPLKDTPKVDAGELVNLYKKFFYV